MNVSYAWLKAFVDFDLEPRELRDVLTQRVVTVDDVVPLRADLAPIIVAKVVECAPHPDSDRLSVTRVDAGTGELLDVVCGAPNVKAGRSYPFAPVGTTMPNGMTIERRKIRGTVSAGMLCSARELGLGDEHQGILELDVDASPGTPFLQAVPVGDTRLVLDVNPNRPDLLSHLGVARELAAALGKGTRWLPRTGARDFLGELTREQETMTRQLLDELPTALAGERLDASAIAEAVTSVVGKEGEGAVSLIEAVRTMPDRPRHRGAAEGETGGVRVVLEDAQGSPRYCGVVIRGVKVGPSPRWLADRITAVGGRPINNVVDATNYMLHGFGQPMHAFDVQKLAGPAVLVRRARAGERLVTLDGVERALTPAMTVIADAERAQALAGIMGGRDSEVTEHSADIFLEVANFDPRLTRSTRRALGMSTDASYRFERGVDVEWTPFWLTHAVALITQVAGGAAAEDVDLYPEPRATTPLRLRVARIARVLGAPIAAQEAIALLRSIGFIVEWVPGTEMLHGDQELMVVPPSWRVDITQEVDLIEEVARLHGFDAFSSELRPFRVGTVPDAPIELLASRIRATLANTGLFEVRPMPFVSGEEGHVRVRNPLAENEAFLRRSIIESLTKRAEYNLAHMQGDVRLFEIGNVFAPSSGRLPHEEVRVGALIMGARRPPHFTEPKPPPFDEWDAKGLAELIAETAFPRRDVELVSGEGGALWGVHVDGRSVGAVARVALDAPVWAAAAFGVEMTLEGVSSADVAPPGRASPREVAGPRGPAPVAPFRALPVTPAAEFDLALLVPNDMPVAQVEAVLRRHAGELLERLALFDEFRGGGLPAGMRSVAWRLTFRHAERTLRDKEVTGRREKLLRALEEELGVRQRTT
ncbi:MAG: YtpR family tRNA-binding protein [Gemmatimonadaceae bacterium]